MPPRLAPCAVMSLWRRMTLSMCSAAWSTSRWSWWIAAVPPPASLSSRRCASWVWHISVPRPRPKTGAVILPISTRSPKVPAPTSPGGSPPGGAASFGTIGTTFVRRCSAPWRTRTRRSRASCWRPCSGTARRAGCKRSARGRGGHRDRALSVPAVGHRRLLRQLARRLRRSTTHGRNGHRRRDGERSRQPVVLAGAAARPLVLGPTAGCVAAQMRFISLVEATGDPFEISFAHAGAGGTASWSGETSAEVHLAEAARVAAPSPTRHSRCGSIS